MRASCPLSVKSKKQPADFAGAQAECDITELHFGPKASKRVCIQDIIHAWDSVQS